MNVYVCINGGGRSEGITAVPFSNRRACSPMRDHGPSTSKFHEQMSTSSSSWLRVDAEAGPRVDAEAFGSSWPRDDPDPVLVTSRLYRDGLSRLDSRP